MFHLYALYDLDGRCSFMVKSMFDFTSIIIRLVGGSYAKLSFFYFCFVKSYEYSEAFRVDVKTVFYFERRIFVAFSRKMHYEI